MELLSWASNDDFGNSLSSRIEWTATKNGTYYMQARHWNPNSGGCDTQYNLLISEGSVSNANGADTTGVFRPSNGLLYLKNKNDTGFADVALNYGLPGDYPVVGDWDGNGTVTIGIYRGKTFYLRNENTNGFATIVFDFGQPGDQPIAGDWDGDGIDTIGIYRPSTGQFLLRNSNDAGPAEMSFYLGNVGDVGIAGDWNGDGKDTTGVFRPSNGVIFLKDTNDTGFADYALNYGLPVTGQSWAIGTTMASTRLVFTATVPSICAMRIPMALRPSCSVSAIRVTCPSLGNWDGQP